MSYGVKNRKRLSSETKERWRNPIEKAKMLDRENWSRKKHSEESKALMRKPKNIGSTNSQYGTCWITKDGLNKKIKKEDLETYLKEGWLKGRK